MTYCLQPQNILKGSTLNLFCTKRPEAVKERYNWEPVRTDRKHLSQRNKDYDVRACRYFSNID